MMKYSDLSKAEVSKHTNQYNAMQRIFIMFNKLSLIAKMFSECILIQTIA